MFKRMRSQRKGGGGSDRSGETRVRRQIILLSILLHILFLSFWDGAIQLDPSSVLPVAPPPKSAPLVFDLQQPELPREVIATPADARTTDRPQMADFLSDKNALARNQDPAPQLALKDDPFSRGDMASHDLLPQPHKGTAARQPAQPPSPKKDDDARTETEPAPPEKDLDAAADLPVEENALVTLPRKPETVAKAKTPFRLKLPAVPHQQLEARAAEDGGLSFNTYDWDFAPYMLALKERISRNIFPPLAFTKLGMIDGDTMLRFKIYPDGRLSDLELLGYTGHHSLMQTSRSAVTTSAPFPSLPADFPKSYLEVTAKFSFFIKK